MKLIIHFPEPTVGPELIALAINLSTEKMNANLLNEDEL